MTEMRVENEVKLVSDGGPFEYDEDPEKPLSLLRHALDSVGMTHDDYRMVRYHDEYFDDATGTLTSRGVILRYRDKGDSAFVTIKQPYVKDGLGLSRRETETELFKVRNLNIIGAVRDHAERYLAVDGIMEVPVLIDDIQRCQFRISSDVRRYKFCFDRIIYRDPVTGICSDPSYELEIESLDQPIKDDRKMVALISELTDKYMFDEIKVSKFARGKAWLNSLTQ